LGLPEDFLQTSGPRVTLQRIDFSKSSIPNYKDLYAIILDNVLSPAECKALVAAARTQANGEWERAMVNIGGGRQALYTDTRNCDRIIWDNEDIMAGLWARCADHVPELKELNNWEDVTGPGPWKRKETWRMTRLNERMRFLKYGKGEYFRREFYDSLPVCIQAITVPLAHCDGCYETPDGKERSYMTLHLYLNDADTEEQEGRPRLTGGATAFHSGDMKNQLDVVPKVGRVLIFQHNHLIHSGDDVLTGTKLTLRTDIMYEKARMEK